MAAGLFLNGSGDCMVERLSVGFNVLAYGESWEVDSDGTGEDQSTSLCAGIEVNTVNDLINSRRDHDYTRTSS